SGDAVIGGKRDGDACAGCGAMQCGDHWFAHGEDPGGAASRWFLPIRFRSVLGVEVEPTLGQVGADAEVLSAAGEYDDANVFVVIGSVEGIGEFVGHPDGVTVTCCGTVQCDGGDAFLDRVDDLAVGIHVPTVSQAPSVGKTSPVFHRGCRSHDCVGCMRGERVLLERSHPGIEDGDSVASSWASVSSWPTNWPRCSSPRNC